MKQIRQLPDFTKFFNTTFNDDLAKSA
jgi:hypothetical protein